MSQMHCLFFISSITVCLRLGADWSCYAFSASARIKTQRLYISTTARMRVGRGVFFAVVLARQCETNEIAIAFVDSRRRYLAK